MSFAAAFLISCTKEQPFFRFEDNSIEIGRGESLQLVIVSSGMEEAIVEWSSSDPETVTVDGDGVVQALQLGEAVVKAVCGEYQAMCRVTVVQPDATGVVLDKKEVRMNLAETFKLTYKLTPDDALESSLVWTSSDETIVSVDASGKLTALAVGEAVITVKAAESEDKCHVTVTNTAEAGDFFYSDGTFSSSLDASKEVIGIVFWAGDPTASDATLAKDHPDCKNGLVVCLNDFAACRWQESASGYSATVSEWALEHTECFTLVAGEGPKDNLNKVVGFNNTKAMKAFNESPDNSAWPISAIGALADLESSHAAPEGTSGWYLPSAKELSLLCTGVFGSNILEIASIMIDNREIVNASLAQVDGADKLLSNAYWSSSEADASTAVTVFFGSGVVASGQKQNQAKVIRN